MIVYRKLQISEANNFWNLMNQLDYETNFMLYEPGEREQKGKNLVPIEQIIEQACVGNDFLMVAEDDSKLVGYLSAQRGALNRIAHSAYIVTGILKEYRNRGIGNELFQHLNQWAINEGITRLELTVVSENNRARHVYEKNGFYVEGIKKNSVIVNESYMDEYYMAKLLVHS